METKTPWQFYLMVVVMFISLITTVSVVIYTVIKPEDKKEISSSSYIPYLFSTQEIYSNGSNTNSKITGNVPYSTGYSHDENYFTSKPNVTYIMTDGDNKRIINFLNNCGISVNDTLIK